MKSLSRWILLLILLLLVGLAVPTTALAQDRSGDEFVFGGVFTLDEGDRLRGNLYVFGGVATVEEKARVSGDVIVFGGALDIAGEVEGDITIMGGNVELRETAVVEGDVNSVGGSITPAEGAVIEGDFNEGLNAPFAILTPSSIFCGLCSAPSCGLRWRLLPCCFYLARRSVLQMPPLHSR